MIYDLYSLKNLILKSDRESRKVEKRIFCDSSQIEISNLTILFTSSEYIKSITSFISTFELNLKNDSLNEACKSFLSLKRQEINNIGVIQKLSSNYIKKLIEENLKNQILSYFYLNQFLLPFKYSLRRFTLIDFNECEYLEGINEVKVTGKILIRFDKLLLELKKEKLIKISIHKRFLESFFLIKFNSNLPKLITLNNSKFLEGINSFFKFNDPQFLFNKRKKKLKSINIIKVSIKNNLIKVSFGEKMISKLFNLKNIFKRN